MRRTSLIWCLMLVAAAGFAHAQVLYVQVEIQEPFADAQGGPDEEAEGGQMTSGCSIARIAADGTVTEYVSNAAILAATGESSADCDDTGLAVAPDGTIYFSEDESHDILQVTPGGAVSVLVDAAVIDAAVGETNDNDYGMFYGQDGNLYLSGEDCDCVYRVNLPAGTVEVLITEDEIGAATGNRDSLPSGAFVADLEGGIVRDADGTLYFADDGSGENASVPDNDSLDSILKAVPNGGGYTLSVLADEADIAAALGNGTTGPGGSPCSDLDLDIDSINSTTLYVLEDGDCGDDGVVAIDKSSGAVSVMATAADIQAATGINAVAGDLADVEGGIAVGPGGVLYVGDDGFDDVDGEDKSNIVRIDGPGSTSLWVSDAAFTSAIGSLYPGLDVRLRGGLDVFVEVQQPTSTIPTLDRWGIAILVVAIAVVGLFIARRFTS